LPALSLPSQEKTISLGLAAAAVAIPAPWSLLSSGRA
jgi:hypothetical protein